MIMVMTMFCLTTATAYNTTSIDYKDAITYKDKRNFNFNYNERKLSDYLKLNTDEKNDLFDIHRAFNEKMKSAAYINDKEKQSNEIIKAISTVDTEFPASKWKQDFISLVQKISDDYITR